MNNLILYLIVLILLTASFIKDRPKTKKVLFKAWKSFSNILPAVLLIMIFVGILLSILSPETISQLIGTHSGLLGIMIALFVGSITLIPSFITFPLAATLLKAGAGYTQVAAFVSTLMSVGLVTLPIL